MRRTDMPAGDVGSDATLELATGCREEARFLGPAGAQLLAFRHLPPSAAVGTVMICSSFFDALSVYRKEVLLTRYLAEHGIAVARVHYRGTGNSDDVPDGPPTVATMADDVRRIIDWLREAASDKPLAIVGVGYGAFVAGAVLAEYPAAPLVLWEPTTDGHQYFREMFRATRFILLRHHPGEEPPMGSMEQLTEQGWTEALGQRVELPSYVDAKDRNLDRAMAGRERPLLLVHFGRIKSLPTAYRRLVERWRARGCDVEVLSIEQRRGWWYIGDPDDWTPEEQNPEVADLLPAMSAWLLRRFGVTDAR